MNLEKRETSKHGLLSKNKQKIHVNALAVVPPPLAVVPLGPGGSTASPGGSTAGVLAVVPLHPGGSTAGGLTFRSTHIELVFNGMD